MRVYTAGEEIREMRERFGWSRRKLASKYGTSRRRIVAVEDCGNPKPKKEQPRHSMVFVPMLGYNIHCFEKLPVSDRNFDLKQQQSRVMHYLDNVLLGDVR